MQVLMLIINIRKIEIIRELKITKRNNRILTFLIITTSQFSLSITKYLVRKIEILIREGKQMKRFRKIRNLIMYYYHI